MSETKAELMLNPIRMRIISLLTLDALTPQQIHRIIPDIPQATLYRHINKLADNDILEIVGENPIRGTVEKVYRLKNSASQLSQEDLANLSKDDHLQIFTAFITGLIGDFSRYMDSRDSINLFTDNVSFAKTPIYLSDDEAQELRQELNKLIMKVAQNKNTPDRKRYLLTGITMPDADKPTIED